jgi:hypothetical protein
MTEKTIDLDQHRGMAAQKATDLRRLLAEVEANQRALRQRRDELEAHLVAAPAAGCLPIGHRPSCAPGRSSSRSSFRSSCWGAIRQADGSKRLGRVDRQIHDGKTRHSACHSGRCAGGRIRHLRWRQSIRSLFCAHTDGTCVAEPPAASTGDLCLVLF